MTGHASFRTLKTIFPALYAGELRLLLVKISNDPTISVAMLHVVACALGTRGDVQPLSLLAWQLAHHISISTDQSPYCPDNRSRRVQVAFVTHAAHKPWLDQLHLAFVDDTAGRQLQFLFISTLPATAWHTAEGSNSRCAGDTRPEDVTRSELLQHCCTALNVPSPSPAAEAAAPPPPVAAIAAQPTAPEHSRGCQQTPNSILIHVQQQQQRQQQEQAQRLLLFNLFALEGYSIAEALHVPCCVVQPYLVPYSMPAGFQRRFQQAAPGLAARLQGAAAAAAAAAAGSEVGGNCGAPCVSWKDVSHWMWPLFTERWGTWRQEVLGLHPWPLVQAVQEGWQGCTFAAAAAADTAEQQGLPSTQPAAAAAAAAAAVSKEGSGEVCQMPGAIPVLYGLSPAVVQQPGYWPQAVQMCGFWLTQQLHKQQHHQQLQQRAEAVVSGIGQQTCRLPVDLQDFLNSCSKDPHQQQQQQQQQGKQQGKQLLVVDFGSMGAIGLLRDAHTLLQVLLGALELLGPDWKCVLLTGGWQPLVEAYQSQLSTCCAVSQGQMAQQQEFDKYKPQQQHEQQQNQQGSHRQPEQQPTEGQQVGQASLPSLFVQHESLGCHHLLLEAADVLLHHGGSGTAAAALAAGVPQLVCPLQFDQYYWAERMADLGCAPSPLAVDKLVPAAAAAAAVAPQPAATAAAPMVAHSAAGIAAEAAADSQPESPPTDKPGSGLETAAAQPVPEAAAAAGNATAAAVTTSVQDLPSTQTAVEPNQRTPGPAATAAAVSCTIQAAAAAPVDAAAARNAAVKAAAASLAAQVLAARQPAMLQACKGLKEELQREDGLGAAVKYVQDYLQHVNCSGSTRSCQ